MYVQLGNQVGTYCVCMYNQANQLGTYQVCMYLLGMYVCTYLLGMYLLCMYLKLSQANGRKWQNLEMQQVLLLRIRRPFSDLQRWCRASKTVSAGGKWSGLSFYVSWSSVPQTVSDLEAKTYEASLLRRRRGLRPFGPSQGLTEALKFCEMARAFRKGKVGLSSSKTHHFRGQNWGPVWFVQMNLN